MLGNPEKQTIHWMKNWHRFCGLSLIAQVFFLTRQVILDLSMTMHAPIRGGGFYFLY